jgi:GAF domain-containing protein
MTSVSVGRVAQAFVEIADTLVDEFDVIEFLQLVTARTSEVANMSAAGLLLADHQGRLQFMAASDERAHLLELFQLQAHEGPCQDCYRQGVPVVNTDLDGAGERWPQFAPRAVAAGFRSVHAFPMRLRKQTIGTLNLFGTAPGRIEPADVHVVQALADVATIGLLQEQTIRRAETLSEQLQGALTSRIIVEQAKGAIAQSRGCTVDEAFQILRTYCRRHGLRMGEVARLVVTDPSHSPV